MRYDLGQNTEANLGAKVKDKDGIELIVDFSHLDDPLLKGPR
jgi:hypothetical protein